MATIRKVKSRAKKKALRKDRYQVIIRRKGVNLTKTFSTKPEAEAWARIKEADVETGKIHSLNASPEGNATIKELFERYVVEKAASKKSYEASEKYLIKRLSDAIGHYTYNELDSQHIVAYGIDRLKTIAGSSLKRELRPLSDMMEYAWLIWQLPAKPNPVRNAQKVMKATKLLKKDPVRTRRPSDAEMDALYLDLSKNNPRCLNVLLFAVETGMRRGEICKLKWKYFDAEQGAIKIPKEVTKTDEDRVVSLTLKATLILGALPKRPGSGGESRMFGYANAAAVGKAFRRSCQRCGIEDLHIHDMRHEALSRWVEGGLSIAEVRVLSGHSSLSSLSRYVAPHQEAVREKLLAAEKKRAKKKIDKG